MLSMKMRNSSMNRKKALENAISNRLYQDKAKRDPARIKTWKYNKKTRIKLNCWSRVHAQESVPFYHQLQMQHHKTLMRSEKRVPLKVILYRGPKQINYSQWLSLNDVKAS